MRCATGIASVGLVVLGLPAALPSAWASGFQLQEQTASGLGVAYSGMPAAVQDAGVAFWNPASMTQLPGMQLTAAMHYIDTSFEFRSAGPPPAGSTYDVFGTGGNAGSGSLVPALYAKFALSPRLAAGLAIGAPFGLTTEWNSPWAGSFHAVKSEVKTLNFNPTLGYQIAPFLSLGAGISYQRLEATLSNGVTPLIPSAQGKVSGDDWAYGWNLGALVLVGASTRIGLTYRSAVDYRIEGDLTFNNAALAPLAADVKADLRLPQTAAVGVSHRPVSNLELLADFTWTGWDAIQSLQVIGAGGTRNNQVISNTALRFKDSWRAGLGAEYELSSTWRLRAGVAYDRSPVQDEFRTPRLPDNDRKWLAAGARFSPSERWSLDVGYAHLWVKAAPSDLAPTGPVPGALLGHYDSSSNVFAAQASFHP